MLTKEEYQYLNGFRAMLDLFEKTGECVGGDGGIYDWHEKKYGVNIDRGCVGCRTGFLKTTLSMLKQYEREHGSTNG